MAINRSQSTKNRPRKLLIAAAAVIVVVLIIGGLELSHVTNFIHRSPETTLGPTPEEKKQAADIEAQQKKDAIENPPADTPSTAPTADTISLSTRQETNGSVTVLTNLGKINDGSCTLTVTNGSATTSQTAAVIYQTEYSTCAGFSVPVSSVGTGTWALTLNVTSGGTTVSKTLQAEVK